MKKIFTLVLALVASTLSMFAADFLYFGDTPVQDGATYTTYPFIEFQDENMVDYKQDSNLFFHGSVGQTFTVEVTADAEIQVCSLATQCASTKANETFVRTGALKTAVEAAQIDKITTLEGVAQPGDLNLITVKVKVTTGGESVSCTIIFSNDLSGAGITAPANDEYIRLAAGNTLAYNVNGASTLQIYGMTGALVGRYHIDGKGTVSLGTLPKGVYIYTDGSHKGKLVVR